LPWQPQSQRKESGKVEVDDEDDFDEQLREVSEMYVVILTSFLAPRVD
jgi:hypothetical protein